MEKKVVVDAMAAPDAEGTVDDGCNPQDTKADWVGGGHCRLRQHGNPSKLVWSVHPFRSGLRGARRTWATLQFFPGLLLLSKEKAQSHLPQNTSLQLSGVRPFSIVPACLDGTTWFSMRVSINHFIGPIDFDSLLVRP